jgi:hypothetical protein
VRDALAEGVLEQLGDRGLTEEADAQRRERDAELAGRQVAAHVVHDLRREGGAALALFGLLLQVGRPRAHEGELGRHEEPVEQDEHDDGDQQQDGHRRAW